MIRRALLVTGALVLPFASFGIVAQRCAARLLRAPRVGDDESVLGPRLDALGGEVVRLRSRDGLRLSGRWLPADPPTDGAWVPAADEAILLLHGYSGSVAPDLVEYGPVLRATAAVLGLDFRGHGGSEDGPTTFGVLELEDVAGALAWLGERGIERVALVGTSMGGMTALAAVAVLGDGSLAGADAEPDAPRGVVAHRPRIIAVVGDSVSPEIPLVIANRISGPFRGFVADRLLAAASRHVGLDLRATEPIRIVSLVAPVPLLLIHGDADTTVPIADGRRLAAAAGPTATHWIVEGAGHSGAHAVRPTDWEARVGAFLRAAFVDARNAAAILVGPGRDGDLAADREPG